VAITDCDGLVGVLNSWAEFTDNFDPATFNTSRRVQDYLGHCPPAGATASQCLAGLQAVTACANATLNQSGFATQPTSYPLPTSVLQQVSSQCCSSLVDAASGSSVDLACLPFRSTMEEFFQPAGPTASLNFMSTQGYLGFQNTSYSYMGFSNASWGASPVVLNTSSATPAQLLAAAEAAWPGPGPFPQLSFFCAGSMPGYGCMSWKVQYPSNYFSNGGDSLNIVTGSASVDGTTTVPPPAQGNPAYMDMGSGGLDHARALAFFLLTHQYSTGSVATPLPSECRRFPEAMCDAAVGRVLNCLAAHDSPTAPLLPSDPYCEGPVGKLVPELCAGYPWRAKARTTVTNQEMPNIMVERFMRAVEVSQQSDGDYGAPCNATVPSLKYSAQGTLLTSHCAPTPDQGYVCVNPGAPLLVSPSTGIAYFEVDTTFHNPSKFSRLSSDGCHSEEYNSRNQGYYTRP